MTKKEYNEMAKNASPKSKSIINIPTAFLVGGLICTLGEWLNHLFLSLGADEEVAGTSVSIALIFLAALLTGLNVYNKIAKYAGAGTLVPITGFSNAVVSPALEFKSEGLILGLGAKLFVIAGPVIVYGISASIVYGIIIYIFKLY